MLRARTRLTLTLAATLAAVTGSSLVSAAPGANAAVVPLKDAAMLTKIDGGYLYRAGQQDSHLTITRVSGGLKFVDTGTREWRKLAGACHRIKVDRGIGAVCRAKRGMTLKIWPRLGDDYINGSRLPRGFRLSVLADAGRDVVYGGAGNDFVNGAQDADRVYGGPGRDWIRTGIGNDTIYGGAGNDKVVGVDGSDVVHGGPGDDKVYGGDGGDRVYGGRGRDLVSCGGGHDHGFGDAHDALRQCEARTRTS